MTVVKFNYSKPLPDGGTEDTQRVIIGGKITQTQLSKNARQNLDGNYVEGWELITDGLLPSEAVIYEETLNEFLNSQPKLSDFLVAKNLDINRIVFKTFKIENIKNFQIIK